jgi:hypothetical protein
VKTGNLKMVSLAEKISNEWRRSLKLSSIGINGGENNQLK